MSTIWDYHCDKCNQTKSFLTPTAEKKEALVVMETSNKLPAQLRLHFVLSLENMFLYDDRHEEGMEYKVELFHGTEDRPEEWGDVVEETETFIGALNPRFVKVFSFNWTRGKGQLWRFRVDSIWRKGNGVSVSGPKKIVVVKVDDFVREKDQGLRFVLDEERGGDLVIQEATPVAFKLAGSMIPRKDAMGGKSDPYVECYWRLGQEEEFKKFYTTKYVDDTEDPVWDERIEFMNFVRGLDMWIKLRVMDYDPMTADDFIGETEVSVADILDAEQPFSLKLSGDPKEQAELTVTPVPASVY